MISPTEAYHPSRNLSSIGESSESPIESSESSFYDAIRAHSMSEIDHDNSLLEQTNPATVAQLLPFFSSAHSTCSLSTSNVTHRRYGTSSTVPPYNRWHPYVRPKTVPSPSTYPGCQRKRTRRASHPTAFETFLRRTVLSLNDADTYPPRKPTWIEHLASPAQPMRPRYPPPERLPTPPGLPSFGTPEAIRFTAYVESGVQFNARDNETRPTSFRDTIRRRLGLLVSPAPAPPAAVAAIDRSHILARAADGTAVLGQFPHRQSGHGVIMTRRLDNHPFHRRTLPVAAPVDVSSLCPSLQPPPLARGVGVGRRLGRFTNGENGDNTETSASGYDGLLRYTGWQAGIFDSPRENPSMVSPSSSLPAPARTKTAAGKEAAVGDTDETDSLMRVRDLISVSLCCWLGRRK